MQHQNRRSIFRVIGGAVALVAGALRPTSASACSAKTPPPADSPLSCGYGFSSGDENVFEIDFLTAERRKYTIIIDCDAAINLMSALHWHLGFTPEAQQALALRRAGKNYREISYAMRDIRHDSTQSYYGLTDNAIDMLVRAAERREADDIFFAELNRAGRQGL